MDWLHDAKEYNKMLRIDMDKIQFRHRFGPELGSSIESVELDTAGQYRLIEYLVSRI